MINRIKVKRKNFITKYAALTFRLLSTGEEKRIGMSLGALTLYIKNIERHPNSEVILIEVPHGYVQKTKDFLKRLSETK